MSFEEFQNQSRLYVIGALEPEETEAFEEARKDFGQKAEDYIAECYTMHEAFALASDRKSPMPERSPDVDGAEPAAGVISSIPAPVLIFRGIVDSQKRS